MAYEIHIDRLGPDGHSVPVALSEWLAAVAQTPNVRVARGDHEVVNPKTGEVIRMTNTGGDAEVLLSGGGQWRRVFRWFQGGISFRAPYDFDRPDCEIRRVAAQLARVLGARLVGEEGETYD